MEIISKVSKGTKMDQIYIPKNRTSLSIGSYVIVKPLTKNKIAKNPYFLNIKYIEPIKVEIINKVFNIVSEDNENVIITGSFLNKGFNFNDIDILLVTKGKVDISLAQKAIENKIGIKPHILFMNNKNLMEGLSTDPLYQMMLSKCISRKRFIYNVKPKINYKLLDLHLLKSKTLIDNFDILNGNEKYYLTKNLISIFLYLKGKRINKDIVDAEIKKSFKINVEELKQNTINKNEFLKKYKEIYKTIFEKIMNSIKNGAK